MKLSSSSGRDHLSIASYYSFCILYISSPSLLCHDQDIPYNQLLFSSRHLFRAESLFISASLSAISSLILLIHRSCFLSISLHSLVAFIPNNLCSFNLSVKRTTCRIWFLCTAIPRITSIRVWPGFLALCYFFNYVLFIISMSNNCHIRNFDALRYQESPNLFVSIKFTNPVVILKYYLAHLCIWL